MLSTVCIRSWPLLHMTQSWILQICWGQFRRLFSVACQHPFWLWSQKWIGTLKLCRLVVNILLGMFVSHDDSLAGMYRYLIVLLVVYAGTTTYELKNSADAKPFLVFAVLPACFMAVPSHHPNTFTWVLLSLSSMCDFWKLLSWNPPTALRSRHESMTSYGAADLPAEGLLMEEEVDWDLLGHTKTFKNVGLWKVDQ